MELRAGRLDIARRLLPRALQASPAKMHVAVLLEYSRLEEFCGNIEKAREILKSAKKHGKYDWKVHLESIMLEIRSRNLDAAMEAAEQAVQAYSNVGRLWACLVQLKGLVSPAAQKESFMCALQEVAKSGEVWAEGARMMLNPFSEEFSVEKGLRYADFATRFTPQYGDSFIETIRGKILSDGSDHDKSLLRACVNSDPYYGLQWLGCKPDYLDDATEVVNQAWKFMRGHVYEYRHAYQRAVMEPQSATTANSSLTEWREFNRNYVHAMYPDVVNMDHRAKFKALFGSSIYSIG